MQYLEMELAHRYPSTKRKFCPQCRKVNGTAWDVVMFHHGARAKPKPNAPQHCQEHRFIPLSERVVIAKKLDGEILYQVHPRPTSAQKPYVPIIAMTSINGSNAPRAELYHQDLFLEPDDAAPQMHTLADYGRRAQRAHQFFETWVVEVEAVLALRSGHRRQRALSATSEPIPSQSQLSNVCCSYSQFPAAVVVQQ